jgi:hypothetical protein
MESAARTATAIRIGTSGEEPPSSAEAGFPDACGRALPPPPFPLCSPVAWLRCTPVPPLDPFEFAWAEPPPASELTLGLLEEPEAAPGAVSEPPDEGEVAPGEPPVDGVPPLDPVAVGGASEYWMPLESA